ncbi:MAG: molybdopterin-dependent oxidoreductase [Deltaproteobacteria bacterium]|nr:molybdopterin-dependent oxidoreductase [Deltaproteobacteria bacterium]
MKNDDGVKVYPTVVWSAGAGCHGNCGQKLYVKDGKLIKVEGDERHPWNQGRSCPRVLALTQYMYHPDRLTYPLKRVGERGEGKFERISWDEAFDTVESKLKAIREESGPESVIFVQGTGRDIGGPITLLAYNYGSPNWVQLGLSGHSCYTPRLAAMKATMGDYSVADCSQFLEKRYDDPEFEVPKVIIVWGNHPTATDPDGFFGHWIVDCMKRGTKIISVDPRYTWLTTRAEYHLRLRPGTGGALALGMLNVIINEGLYDKAFVEKWTYGFDELKERVQEFTPSKTAEITEVPEDLIAEAARFYAGNKPGGIHWGVAVDMEPEGTTVAQAIMHLWCITGNVDNPGGNVIARPSHGITTYPYSSEELRDMYGADLMKLLNEKRIGADKYPMVKNFRGWAQPDVVIDQVASGKPYPIKAAWIQTANLLGGQSARWQLHYDALKKLEFIAVVDLFHNPTTMALADIVLPAATFAEKNSYRSWWAPLSVIQKVVQVGECKSDWEINFELAKRFNPEGVKADNLIDFFNIRLGLGGKSFQELVDKGCWEMPPEGHHSRPYRRHERGLLRPDGKAGFNTETGKIELYSKTFEEWGIDPLPFFVEPFQSPVSTPDLFKKYPLIMITGARSSVYFHAEHRMIPWLREKEPDPYVEIHPETAKKYDIYDGEWIYIKNDLGRVKRKAKITLTVKPQHIQTLHGWWMPEMKGPEPDLYGVRDYQINRLVPGPQASSSGFGGGQYKTTLVTLEKITEGGK